MVCPEHVITYNLCERIQKVNIFLRYGYMLIYFTKMTTDMEYVISRMTLLQFQLHTANIKI